MHYLIGFVFVVALVVFIPGMAFAYLTYLFGHPYLTVMVIVLIAASAGLLHGIIREGSRGVDSDLARIHFLGWRMRPEIAALACMLVSAALVTALSVFYAGLERS
ncbi:hypothetical protein [Hyphomonas sp.]|uniref:hypothetical protein n=1 Tax=Hyphomonas sp. TaxID=87 RepID=UPI0025C4E005|nr:hypothetical protein [Hyphomonas sp.]